MPYIRILIFRDRDVRSMKIYFRPLSKQHLNDVGPYDPSMRRIKNSPLFRWRRGSIFPSSRRWVRCKRTQLRATPSRLGGGKEKKGAVATRAIPSLTDCWRSREREKIEKETKIWEKKERERKRKCRDEKERGEGKGARKEVQGRGFGGYTG